MITTYFQGLYAVSAYGQDVDLRGRKRQSFARIHKKINSERIPCQPHCHELENMLENEMIQDDELSLSNA